MSLIPFEKLSNERDSFMIIIIIIITVLFTKTSVSPAPTVIFSVSITFHVLTNIGLLQTLR